MKRTPARCDGGGRTAGPSPSCWRSSPRLRRNGAFAAGFSILGALTTLVSSFMLLFRQVLEQPEPILLQRQWIAAGEETVARLGMLVDGTSVLMMCVVALVATMVQIFSVGYLADEPEHDRGRYFTWQSLFPVSR